MANYTYPQSDLDRGRVLLSVLGSFWSRTYTARDQVQSYTLATAESVLQSHRNLLETIAALSRYDVPLFHTENWVPITLKKSQMNTGAVGIARFDDGSLALSDGRAQFNQPSNRPYFAFPKLVNLVSVSQIFNKLIFPTTALMEKTDYIIDSSRDALVFAENPFNNPAFLRRPVYDGNQLVDEEIVVWGFLGAFDYQYVFKQFAYALGMRLDTSQGYKDLMNAVTTGLISGGATASALDLAFSAISGVPVAADDETVDVVQIDSNGLFIATDKNVYRFVPTAAPVVAVGDKLTAGDRLVDAVNIVELSAGAAPSYIPALALDTGFLSACFYGDLVFENKDVPLEVDVDHPSGYTYVKFGLGGLPADVTRFFDDVHARGVESATTPPELCPPGRRRHTLAQILDKRAQPEYVVEPQIYPVDEPTAANLPATINPLQFVVANILRNNVFLIQIKSVALGQNRLGLYNIRHLRQLLPPHTAMIVLYEMGGIRDVISGADNLTESTTTFTGMAPIADVVHGSLVTDDGATARIFSGTCQ
jgi:hypothetical protein